VGEVERQLALHRGDDRDAGATAEHRLDDAQVGEVVLDQQEAVLTGRRGRRLLRDRLLVVVGAVGSVEADRDMEVGDAAGLALLVGVVWALVRRYVQRLVDLGLPVDSERGPYGGYRLRPRYRLPPLLLTPDEGVAVTLGLLVARPLGVGTAGRIGGCVAGSAFGSSPGRSSSWRRSGS
jgi:hypothetical protein